jgi:hypothetical protein
MVSQRGQVASEENVAKQRTSGVNSSAAAKGGDHAINVVKLLKLPKPFVDVFGNVEGEYGRFLTPGEARNVLLSYIAQQNFETSDGGASISVPPESPLYKLLKLAKYDLIEAEVRESAVSAAARTSTSAPRPHEHHDDPGSDKEGEAAHETGGARMVAGVMVSSVSELVRTSQAPSAKPAAVKKDAKSKHAGTNPSSKISVYKPSASSAVAPAVAPEVVIPPPEPVVAPLSSAIISKQDVVNKFVSKLTPYYAVVNKRGAFLNCASICYSKRQLYLSFNFHAVQENTRS